jgi:hypothetical protein
MKKLFLLALIVMNQLIAHSQQKMSCHPTEEFAMFSKDTEFKSFFKLQNGSGRWIRGNCKTIELKKRKSNGIFGPLHI